MDDPTYRKIFCDITWKKVSNTYWLILIEKGETNINNDDTNDHLTIVLNGIWNYKAKLLILRRHLLNQERLFKWNTYKKNETLNHKWSYNHETNLGTKCKLKSNSIGWQRKWNTCHALNFLLHSTSMSL